MEDKTKKRIIELCPDILELKFGCETSKGIFLGENTTEDEYHFFVPDKVGSEDYAFTCDAEGEIKNAGKILGRPITLADVLRAIKPYKVTLELDNRAGTFLFLSFGGYHRIWQLEKDYDNQSQETKDFIGSIIN